MGLLDDIPIGADPRAREIRGSLARRRCWYAYTSFGNTFQISLGRKIPRDPAESAAIELLRRRRLAMQTAKGLKVTEDSLSRVFDRFTGEANLLVWCPWRLDEKRREAVRPITSWDDDSVRCRAGIRRLVGRTAQSAAIQGGWFLQVTFSGGIVLNVFPTHVGPNASFDGNWELWKQDVVYEIDTYLTCQLRSRKAGAQVPSAAKPHRQRLLKEAV